MIVCHGVQKHCHTSGAACYGMICVFADLCSKPARKLTRDDLRRVNRIRKHVDLEPLKIRRRK